MDSMILGRYIPGDSIIHRLDPRSKLLAMILLILIVFWANNPLTNVILFVATGIFIRFVRRFPLIFRSGIKIHVLPDCFYDSFSTLFHFKWKCPI